jgi:hypothetical protein
VEDYSEKREQLRQQVNKELKELLSKYDVVYE